MLLTLTPKTEAVMSSDEVSTYKKTSCHNPENHKLNGGLKFCKNEKSFWKSEIIQLETDLSFSWNNLWLLQSTVKSSPLSYLKDSGYKALLLWASET